MANPNSRREFLLAGSSTAVLGLVSCLAPALVHSEVNRQNKKMDFEYVIRQRLEDYVQNGIFPIIEAEAVSKHKSPAQMRPIAEQVKMIMGAYGIENLQILQEAGSYPAVYGEVKSLNPLAPTILIQGHYDGQPSDASKWTKTKPHEPKIIFENGERRIYGRGSSDDWGQIMTHIAVVDAYKKTNTSFPANIKFLIEGGEESGSNDMDKLILKYKNLLACDTVMITDSSPGREGHPVITTTSRGIVSAYITLQTGTGVTHSGDNLADNAVALLASILTSMKDYATSKVLLPYFYDKVQEYTAEERKKLQQIPFDLDLFKKNYGLHRIVTEQGYSAQETMWTRPSFEVHTLVGGEKSNSITTTAESYVTMRIVPNQNPEDIFSSFSTQFREHARRLGLASESVQIRQEAGVRPFSTSTKHPFFHAAEKAMEKAFGASVDYMGNGGSEPIAIYHQQLLKVPIIFNAYNSPKDNYHGNDESFSIEKGLVPGIKANALFYENVGRMGR